MKRSTRAQRYVWTNIQGGERKAKRNRSIHSHPVQHIESAWYNLWDPVREETDAKVYILSKTLEATES